MLVMLIPMSHVLSRLSLNVGRLVRKNTSSNIPQMMRMISSAWSIFGQALVSSNSSTHTIVLIVARYFAALFIALTVAVCEDFGFIPAALSSGSVQLFAFTSLRSFVVLS